MTRQLHRLSALQVRRATSPGLFADGGGLYLRVSSGRSAGKRWVFIYSRPADRKRCEIGLGGAVSVSLAQARRKAEEARASVAEGLDPRLIRNTARRVPTFGEVSDAYIASMAQSWRNDKHVAQWRSTLSTYAMPIRQMPVDAISTADVLTVLQPIWRRIPETASRLRGRIEAILDAAKAQGHRTGENPAAWRGHLKLLLPARQRLTRGHHAAMGIDAVPLFVKGLRLRSGVAARCLEFAILTAARSGEAMGARWDEIDLEAKLWRVPASRMKAGREHRVPLSDQAVAIILAMQDLRDSAFVFPGQRRHQPLSVMALTMVLRRLGSTDVTVHGFRATFRDWCGNRTEFPRELAEHALAHIVGDKAEQAYRRDSAVERRRPMMQMWAKHLAC